MAHPNPTPCSANITTPGGTLNMSIGWASAHFGILLVEKQTVSDPTLNVIGFFFAATSIIFYAQVRP
jgi:hypothetical protein